MRSNLICTRAGNGACYPYRCRWGRLKADLDFQILATTHAPLVLASAEPYWDEDQDSLFLFQLVKGAKEVSLRSLGWAKQETRLAA